MPVRGVGGGGGGNAFKRLAYVAFCFIFKNTLHLAPEKPLGITDHILKPHLGGVDGAKVGMSLSS